MYLEEQSESPKVYRAENDINLKFKAKEGKFSLYVREKKEKVDCENVEIIPISDSRFTIKSAMNEPGEFIFSGLYKDARGKLTVLKSSSGKTKVYAEGAWSEIKKDTNLKFTRVVFCLLNTSKGWMRTEFELQGIAAVMWSNLAEKRLNGILGLSVSLEKSFSTPLGKFYEMVPEVKGTIGKEEDDKAREYAEEIRKMYESYDKIQVHYSKAEKEREEESSAVSGASQLEKDVNEVMGDALLSDDDVSDQLSQVPY